MALLSGQIEVVTAGTAVQGPDVGGAGVGGNTYIKALSSNTGAVWVGNDGADDVAAGNGYELAPGDDMRWFGNLNELWFDADTNGNKVSWHRAAK